MRLRSFSHTGVTVADFNRAVRFYWDVFGCPLVGVSEVPADRLRSFFGVDSDQPTCKIGWIRVPGGAVLEIFELRPDQPPADLLNSRRFPRGIRGRSRGRSKPVGMGRLRYALNHTRLDC